MCDKINNCELFGSKYIVYKCDRSHINSNKKIGGGTLIAVKISLSSSLVHAHIESINEEVWVKLSLGDKYLYLCSIYFPPLAPLNKYNSFIERMNSISADLGINDNILAFGDFNLPNLQWISNETDNTLDATNCLNERDECIINGTADCFLRQINFVNNTNNRLLDLVFV